MGYRAMGHRSAAIFYSISSRSLRCLLQLRCSPSFPALRFLRDPTEFHTLHLRNKPLPCKLRCAWCNFHPSPQLRTLRILQCIRDASHNAKTIQHQYNSAVLTCSVKTMRCVVWSGCAGGRAGDHQDRTDVLGWRALSAAS